MMLELTDHRENLVAEIRAKRRQEEEKNKEEMADDDGRAADANVAQGQGQNIGFVKGVLDWLGRSHGEDSWVNPAGARRRLVNVKASSSAKGKPRYIASPDFLNEFQTFDENKQWVQIELPSCKCAPTSYSLVQPRSASRSFLRSWRFLASNDEKKWVTLREHCDDHALSAVSNANTWSVDCGRFFYRYFRVEMTGPSSSKDGILQICAWELQGAVLRNGRIHAIGEERIGGAEKFEKPHLESGDVYCFGTCNQGVMGNGSGSQSQTVPTPIAQSYFGGQQVTKLSCYSQHCVALTASGRVFTWGSNRSRALGHAKVTSDVYRPTRVEIESAEELKFIDIAAGLDFTLLVDQAGALWACGQNTYNQLGTNNSKASPTFALSWAGMPEFAQRSLIRDRRWPRPCNSIHF